MPEPRKGGESPQFSTEEIIERLERLWKKLEDDGWYVNANTITLAIERLKQLEPHDDHHPVDRSNPPKRGRPKTITDMRTYKANKAKQYRASKRLGK